jgi:hypothetical protein
MAAVFAASYFHWSCIQLIGARGFLLFMHFFHKCKREYEQELFESDEDENEGVGE